MGVGRTARGIVRCGETVHGEGAGGRAGGVEGTHLLRHSPKPQVRPPHGLQCPAPVRLQGSCHGRPIQPRQACCRLQPAFSAGVLEALLIVTPFEVVKIRLQQQKGLSPDFLKYNGPIHCARTIIREELILGLWAGAAATVMRNGTNQAAMFTAKNACDNIL